MSDRILSAKLLYLGDGEVIQNGFLKLSDEGVLLEIGRRESIEKAEMYEALCPGMINTHCHLELSHLHEKVPMHKGLHQFIPSIQSQRKSSTEEISTAIQKWDQKMKDCGIVAVGDITNGKDTLEVKKSSSIFYHSFIELFGLRTQKAEEILSKGLELKEIFLKIRLSASLAPHSPYSVSDPLFESIRENEKAGPISIHNQESMGEIEMFTEKDGPLKKMLTDFGNQEDSLPSGEKGSLARALEYFNPSTKTLLVHNTFTQKEDIERASESHSDLYWCFCPSANWYIEKKLPNIPLFIEKGVKCTLGTDSLASNHQLSILEEMKLIQKHYPEISIELMLKWACKNGADFLGIDEGSFKLGKKVRINSINGLDSAGRLQKDSSIQPIQ